MAVSTHHVVLFPYMSKGHTIPLLQFARLLLRHRRKQPTISLTVTVFTTPKNQPFVSDFLSDTPAINVISLPFPEKISGIPPGVESTDKLPSMSLYVPFTRATKLLQPFFEESLKNLPEVSFMVTDGFLWWTGESAAKFKIPRLVFYGINSYVSAVSVSTFEQKLFTEPDTKSDTEPVTVPDFPWIRVNKCDLNIDTQPGPAAELIMDQIMSTTTSHGFLVNSFYELETTFVDYNNNSEERPKSWCIGPLCMTGLSKPERAKPDWIHWLDRKGEEGRPVLYVAFGTQAEISNKQIKELALGLEDSKVNFVWVTRKDVEEIIGEEFKDRIKETGMIVRDWVDQWEILSHESVKGFLSHCGWNSALESICVGVPILAWPMMAEQPLNAKMVVEEIKVGVRVHTQCGSVQGLVTRDELSGKLHAVYGEWLLSDCRWEFVVDDLKGARLFLLNENSTHDELVAMAQENYNLDMRKVTVEISYSLPAEMMMAPGSPPIHVTSDRQVRNLLEILKTHRVCLCVSSRSKVETVSEKRDNDEAGEWEEDVGDDDEADEWEEDVGDKEFVEDENQDEEEENEEEENGEEENGEEDADNSIVGETDQNGGDYSFYGKLPDEDEEDDDNICFEEMEKTYAKTNAIGGGKSDGISIYVNQSFVSKDALLSELRLEAVKGNFSFKIYKSTKTLLVAKCRVSGCRWKIRASVKHGTKTFWVTKYVEKHLCSVGDRIAQRRHCTPKYVGSLFIDRVGIIDGITPQHITDAMKNMFGMELDYTTSYRALLYAQTLVRGSPEEGYSRLASYLEQISIANPDSITAIELDSLKRFKYLFLSFGASIKGFKYQRRVIVVDGTHLSGKYGGVMLVAAAQDGNFQIFPLAFGIVDIEDEPSWEWFFTKLASCISHDKPLVIVSDRHAAIKSACEKVFPWATRGICYYHLQDNIVKKFKGKHLMYLVKGAAYAHTVYDFDRYMAKIRSANPELEAYLEKADVRLWSRVYCKGNRFNIKTSNIAESINSALKKARGFPIPFLLEFIRQKLGKWYWKRRQDALSLTTQNSRGVEHLLAVRTEIADTMTAERIDGWVFFVKDDKMDCVVDLEHVKCDCGVFGVEKIPCSHAIAVGTHARLHIDTLVCPLYTKDYLYAGYSENIYPIVSQHIEERECFPPDVKRGPGRQKKSRWQSWLELSRMKGHKPRKKHRPRRCSNCKESGHTKPQCTQPVD